MNGKGEGRVGAGLGGARCDDKKKVTTVKESESQVEDAFPYIRNQESGFGINFQLKHELVLSPES